MKNDENNKSKDHIPVSLALGTCLGLAVGQGLFNDPGMGLAIGMCFGVVVGASLNQRQKNKDKPPSD
ncbi:glycine zipper family protein [Amylibacter sp. SFDW26]|uniref:glycine zipper family protein n=1 Tax=Amylibacter sp. SFDW26 TaxID=2652722 RepID=UPI001261C5EE|nr:glycine zipper family protein [Amylibacter sp. SFDW26]KAB7613336.1 glycine zipper family protein [Amylibacter sp. SFDW26]